MAGPPASRENLGFRLAKASQRWNELLQESFAREGYPEVRASYGSVLLPLFEEDGLRMGEVARRARLSKQAMTTLVRLAERDGLVERRVDEHDRRAMRVHLTEKGRRVKPVAARVLTELNGLAESELGARGVAATERALTQLANLKGLSP